MSSSTASTHSSSTARPIHPSPSISSSPGTTKPPSNSRIPVTPAVLRAIFASSRTPNEERSISRIAFFRFVGFLLSCVGIAFVGGRGRRGLLPLAP